MNDINDIKALFDDAGIEGMDFDKGLGMFAGQVKIYLKILKTFIDNIGGHLEELAALSEPGLADYAIRVHGVKGSCYGIAAMKEGDLAKELEFAAKGGDYALVSSKNQALIDAVYELRGKLAAFLDAVRDDGPGGEKKAAPDKELLAGLAEAVETYDVDKVRSVVEELEKFSYAHEKDRELVEWLSAKATSFEYEEISEKLKEIS
ncbi:MAG: hypothetical protein LBK04_03250 [Clostridiales Family XIII bacterium]|jgi:hypothetical protein|nr:hypothetical protein [Clostridiales Family XIII bacterium]